MHTILVKVVNRLQSFKRNAVESVTPRLTIHDAHNLFQHLLVVLIDLSNLIVSPMHPARAQMRERLRHPLVNALVKVDQPVQKVLPLLRLHQHRSWITWQFRIHFPIFLNITPFWSKICFLLSYLLMYDLSLSFKEIYQL